MQRQPPHYPLRFFALLTLGAVGLALVAVGITGATGWWLVGFGFGALLVSLPGVWVIHAAHHGRHEFSYIPDRRRRKHIGD
jgi:membrane protein YdbS with pleckstrin-like domain